MEVAADKLSEDDLERHRRMIGLCQEAQQLQARAQQLAGAFAVWCEELHERYGLATDGSEGVNADGTINRADNR